MPAASYSLYLFFERKELLEVPLNDKHNNVSRHDKKNSNHIFPLVEGSSVLKTSLLTAILMALPSPLKIASIL